MGRDRIGKCFIVATWLDLQWNQSIDDVKKFGKDKSVTI